MSEFAEPPELPPLPPPPAAQPIPWERPGAGLGDLWSTFTLIVTSPSEAFSRLRATNAVGRAITFGLIVYVIATAIAQLWGLVLGDMMRKMLEQMTGSPLFGADQQPLSPVLIYLLQVLAAPVIFLLGSLFWSGIIHLMLLMFGGAPGGFTTTLRVSCYSAVVGVANVIPVAGGLITTVWGIVLMIIGLKEAHRVPTGRAAAAVLVPLVLCCICVAVLAFVFAATLATLFSRAAQ